MALDLEPFDFVKHLKDDDQIVVFVEDALASGDARVFARAIEIAARAKGLDQLADDAVRVLRELDGAGEKPLSFSTVTQLLARLGLAMHLAPVAAAA